MIRPFILIFIALFSLGITSPSETIQAREPQELCFASWQWYEDEDGSTWDTPWRRNTLGMIDLRTLPQQGTPGPTPQGRGLFILDTAGLCADSGMPLSPTLDTILTPLESLILEEQLGLPAGSMALISIEQAIWDIFTVHADPTGQTAVKPIRGRISEQVTLRLPAYGVIRQEAFTPTHLTNTEEVFKADYRRNKNEGTATSTLRAWTEITMIKIYGEANDANADRLMPPEHRDDGWGCDRETCTEITDNFNRPNNTDLNASDAGKTLDGAAATWQWTEVDGQFAISGNEVRANLSPAAASFPASARAERDLSSDDQRAEIDNISFSITGAMTGVATRFSPASKTYYAFWARDSTSFGHNIDKIVSGVHTNLKSDSIAESAGFNIRGESEDSTLTLFIDDVQYSDFSITDTSITGNLRTGIVTHSSDNVFSDSDNFSAADLAVPAATPQRIIIIKNKTQDIMRGMKMLVQADIERFMNIQKILQEQAIKTFIGKKPLAPGEQLANHELLPIYFKIGKEYGLKDNELARAILRPVFIGGL